MRLELGPGAGARSKVQREPCLGQSGAWQPWARLTCPVRSAPHGDLWAHTVPLSNVTSKQFWCLGSAQVKGQGSQPRALATSAGSGSGHSGLTRPYLQGGLSGGVRGWGTSGHPLPPATEEPGFLGRAGVGAWPDSSVHLSVENVRNAHDLSG